MQAPSQILNTWRKFDEFPMETLTKAWFFHKTAKKKQRDIALMREHRSQYGIAGNCFDLAIWLLNEFTTDGIAAYPIGHHLKTEKAHVAVIALDERGKRYLCDLGDQWLNPILIDSANEDFTAEKLSGFFPAAQVQINPVGTNIGVLYHRSNRKVSQQNYETEPIEMSLFMEAAEFSQSQIKPRPLLEVRNPYKNEMAHWEFYNWQSFLSTTEGLFNDQLVETIDEWVERINGKTGYDKQMLEEALNFYRRLEGGIG